MNILLLKKMSSGKGLIPGYTAFYLCNAVTGNTLIDISGNGHNGIINGATAVSSGLSFDGNDKVSVTGISETLSSGATIQAVVKPGTDVTTQQSIFYGGGAVTMAYRYGKILILAPSGNAGCNLLSDADAVVPETWVDIAGTIQWEGELKTYRNGILNGQGTTISPYVSPIAPQEIGNGAAGSFPILNGILAVVVIYPFTLTPLQIAHNHAYLKNLCRKENGIKLE